MYYKQGTTETNIYILEKEILFFELLLQSYMVVLATSFMLSSGSALSGQRRIHGANTMASELGDIRLCASSLYTLQEYRVNAVYKFTHFGWKCRNSDDLWCSL